MIVRESCRCGASVEFDDRSMLPSGTNQRLTEFRREHICAPENPASGEVQPEAVEVASGASPGAVCGCGHDLAMHEPSSGQCWGSVVTRGASATGSLRCLCRRVPNFPKESDA